MTTLLERLGLPADWEGGSLTLARGRLGAAADAVLADWGGTLTVDDAVRRSGPEAELIIEGTGSLFDGELLDGAVVAQAGRPVRLEFDEVDGDVHLAVVTPLDGDAVGAFLPRLPTLPGSGSGRRHLLDHLAHHGTVDDLTLVVQSHDDATPRRRAGVPEVVGRAGANLFATYSPSAGSGLVAGWSQIGIELPLHGSLVLEQAGEPEVLAPGRWPWDDGDGVGRLTLRADLTPHLAAHLSGVFELDGLSDAGRVELVAYSAIDDDVSATAPQYWPQLALEVTLAIGSGAAASTGRFVLPLAPWTGEVRLAGRFESLGLHDALTTFAGSGVAGVLPDGVADALASVEVDRIDLGLRGHDDLTPTDVGIGCAFDGSVSFEPVVGVVEVGLDRLDVRVLDPTGPDPTVLGTLAGRLTLFDAVFDVEVATPGFHVTGHLRDGSVLELDTAFRRTLGIDSPVDVDVIGAEVTADDTGHYAVGASLAGGVDSVLPALRLDLSTEGWSIASAAEDGSDGLTLASLLAGLGELVPSLGPSSPPPGADAFGVTAFALSSVTETGTIAVSATCRLDVGDLADDELLVTLTGERSGGDWSFVGELDAAGLDLAELLESAMAEAGGVVDVPDGAVLISASVAVGSAAAAAAAGRSGAGIGGGSRRPARTDIHLGLRAEAAGVDVWLDLWREGSSWRPLVQVGGATLPDDLPVPAAIGDMLEETTIRWAGGSAILPSAPRLGTTPGPVHPGLSLLTMLPFHRTVVGELIGLDDSPVPIELAAGRLELDIEHDLLGGDTIDLDGVVIFRALSMRYTTPAVVGLQVGADLHLQIEDVKLDLRFGGKVEADLTKGDVLLAVAFLGAIRNGETVPWDAPFGFPGLTIGAMELAIGPSIRALRGAVRAGRASLEVEAIWDQKNPLMTAARFSAVSLTLQDLLDGFIGLDAPQLPGPLGQTGFEMVELDYAAMDFRFDWITGPRHYEQGLKGAARINLFGLDGAAKFDLEARRLAASIERVSLGRILTLEATRTASPPDWAVGFSDLGGPFVTLDLGSKPSGRINGTITVFGVVTTEVDGEFDDSGMRLLVKRTIETPIVTTRTDLLLSFANRDGVPDIGFAGGLSVDVELNPRKLAREILGIDAAWLDVDLLDIEVSIEAAARVRGTAISGSFGAAFVLWGKRVGFQIAVSLDLDLEAIGAAALDAVKNAALEALRFFERLGEAILEAVTAVVDAIVEVGEAIVQAFEAVADAVAAVGRAFEALGKAIAELAEGAWNEISSWFGDDSGKREAERRKRAAERRHRRLKAEEETERRRARQLQRNRELLLLDTIDNLADGATFDRSYLDAVQRRIDASDRTRINPFTQTAEWDPFASRARHNLVWQQAMARAGERSVLRDRYESAMDAAGARIRELELGVTRATDDLGAARARLARAEGELARLRDQRDRLLAAMHAATDLALDAREGAVKVEIALDTADALQARLRDDAAELDRGAADLEHLTGYGHAMVADHDEAVRSLAAALDLADEDADDAAALVRRAEARLTEVQNELTLIRDSRASLTLARLDAVQRSVGLELTGIEVFGAWVDACREAGNPALVNVTSLRGQAEQLLQSLPSMLANAVGEVQWRTDRVDTTSLTARPSVVSVAEAVEHPRALLEVGSALGSIHATMLLQPVALTPAWLDLGESVGGGLLVGGRPADLDPPDIGLPPVLVDPAALLAWADTAPVAWAVAEAVRPDDWASRVEPMVETVVSMWTQRRRVGIQAFEADLRLQAELALLAEVEEGKRLVRRQQGQRQLARLSDRSNVLVHLRSRSGRRRFVYERSENGRGPWSRETTTDSTISGRARAEGDHLLVYGGPNLLVSKHWIRVPFEDVVRIAPYDIREEIGIGILDVVQQVARQIEQQASAAVASIESVLASEEARKRHRTERTLLQAQAAVFDATLQAVVGGLIQAERQWAGSRLAGPALAVGVADVVLADARPLDELVAVPSDPGAVRAAVEAKTDALARLSRTAGEVARLGSGLPPLRSSSGPVPTGAALVAAGPGARAEVGDEQLARFMRWTISVADHGDVTRRLLGTIDSAGEALDHIAADLGPRWRGETLGLVAANGAAVGAEARARVLAAIDRAGTVVAAARAFDAELADLEQVSNRLRELLRAQRSQIDAALERIGRLTVGDQGDTVADVEREVGALETAIATAKATADRVAAILDEVADDLRDQSTRQHDRDSLAALERLRLTVSTSRDQRLLRSAVEQANATLTRIGAIGRTIEPVEGRLAEVDAIIDRFDRHDLPPSLTSRMAGVEQRFAEIGVEAEAISAALPELLTAALDLIATIRTRQGELVEHQRAVFEAMAVVAVTTDRLLVEWERTGRATAVLVAGVDGSAAADDASAATVDGDEWAVAPAGGDPVEVTAEVHRRLADLVHADAAQAELGAQLRAGIVDRAARLAIIDPEARRSLDAARRVVDDEARLAAGPPQRLVPPESMTTAPVERRNRWSGEDPNGPEPLADGYTIAFRVRIRRPVDATLLEGAIGVTLRGRTLRVSLPGVRPDRPTRLRAAVESGTTNDVAIVVWGDRQAVLWVNGVPVAHGPTVVQSGPADRLLGAEVPRQRGGPTIGDLRCLARPLGAEEVSAARHHGVDPAEAALVLARHSGAIGRFDPPPSVRPGVPDGAVLVRTARGDLVVRRELRQLPWDTEAVLVGHGAGMAFHGEPDLRGNGVEFFVDRTGIDVMGVESMRVLSLTPSLDAKRWVLEVGDGGGRSGLVAVEHDSTGALTAVERLSTVGLFDLATTGEVRGRDRGISIRSAFNRALLSLDGGPRCEPSRTDPAVAVPDPTAFTLPGGDADDEAGLVGGTIDGEARWLATGPAGPRLVGPDPVTSVNLFVTPVADAGTFTFLRWRDEARRYRLVLLLDRLCLVADESEVVAISRSLASGRTVHMRVEPGGPEVIRVERARRPSARSASAGVPLVDAAGAEVGVWHRLMVNRPSTRPQPRRRSRTGTRRVEPPAEAVADIAFAGERRIRVGASVDPYHDRPGTGTAGGSFAAARPLALDGAVTLSAWIRPMAPVGRRGWSALTLIDDDGDAVLRLHRPRSNDRAVVEYRGEPVPVADGRRTTALPELPPDRWSHVAIRLGRRGRATRLSVLVDGETVVDRRVTAVGRRSLRLTAGDERCAVNHVLAWDRVVDDADLHRHLLRPTLALRPVPRLSWRLDGDGDADGIIRGQEGIAAVFVDDRRRLVAAGSHPLTDVLPERPRQADEPILLARPAGAHHGRPAFRLAELVEGRRRWLRWTAGEGFTTTRRVSEASVVSLRAFAGDRLDLDSGWLSYRLYGDAAEDPAALAATYDYPPATGPIATRERLWDDAMRRALDDELADRDQLTRSRATAAATAEALLAAAWIDVDLPADDLEAARATVVELGRLNDSRFTGLRFGPGAGSEVRLRPSAPIGDAFTLGYWIAGDDRPPSGPVVAYVDADGRHVVSVRHLPEGADGTGGPAIAVTVASQEVVVERGVDADWHHVAITWRSHDGRLRVRVDGGRAMRGSVGTGMTLPGGELVIGASERTGRGERFVGRVEQVALWPGERSVGRQRQERIRGIGPATDGVDLASPITIPGLGDDTEARADRVIERTWRLTERGGADPVGAGRLADDVSATFATPPIVERLERWERLVGRAAEAGDASATALIEGIGRKPHRAGLRIDDIHRALAAAGARPTREAMSWPVEIWTHAIGRFEPSDGVTVRARLEALGRAGIEIRMTRAASPRTLGRALGGARGGRRVEVARELGWYPVDPSDVTALTAAGEDDLAKLTGGVSSRRDVHARRLGLEPMWEPVLEPPTVRRDAIAEAMETLDAVRDPRPSPAQLLSEIHLGLLMLVPLPPADDDWLVAALRRDR